MGGSILVTLGFVAILYPLTVLLSLYSPQDYFLVTIWELLLISGNRTRHQWLYWTSVPSACICPLSPPGIPFLLPPFFLNAELRRWVTDGSRKHEPLLFSASLAPSFPITCSCHVEEDFLFPLLSGAVPLNYTLHCL